MKSRYLSALTILLFCLPFTTLVAAPPPKPPSLESRVLALEALVGELQTMLAANNVADATAGAAIDALQLADSDLQNQIDNIDTGGGGPDPRLDGVVRETDPDTGYDILRFVGMNVQIVNGEDDTETINGTGNLIIGYNEPRNEDYAVEDCPSVAGTEFNCNRRTGSHNLVIGAFHNYSSYGGLVAGHFNETSGNAASVSGGSFSIASGLWSSVSGGQNNTASNEYSSVSGGVFNDATGAWSTVSGGANNEASEVWSSVSGGADHTASGEASSVSGGLGNEASGDYSSVSGGYLKTASSDSCTVGDDGIDC